MTESQWNKLRPGDYIRSKREPSSVLKVVESMEDHVWVDHRDEGRPRALSYLRAKEFERYEPREGEKV